VIILLGRFWQRATWQGALAALVTTPAVALAVMFIPAQAKFWGNPIIPATVAGVIVHLAVSWFSPPKQRSFEEVAEALSREREAVEGKSETEISSPITANVI
jgi:solute:Na+ symporter, SSS family